jgi:hydroxyacylglutathione hydrolase
MLFESLNKLKKEVDHSVRIYPTHGSGSSCGKNIGDGNFCTFETQLGKNYALKINEQKEFVDKILAEMPKPPSYFFHDAKLNQTCKANRFDDILK